MSGLGRSPLPHLPKNAAALRREMGFSDEEIQRFLKKKWHHEVVGNLGQGGDRWLVVWPGRSPAPTFQNPCEPHYQELAGVPPGLSEL